MLRAATSAVALPVVIVLIIAGGPAMAAAVAALLAVAVLEFGLGMRLDRRDPVLWLALAGVVAMTAAAMTDQRAPSLAAQRRHHRDRRRAGAPATRPRARPVPQ